MKLIALLISISFLNICSAQSNTNLTTEDVKFVELNYGIANATRIASDSDGVIVKPAVDVSNNMLSQFEIVKKTDSVETKMKAKFGIKYMFTAKDTMDIYVDIEWIYPKTVKNNGKKFKSIRYTTKRPTNIPSASSYSIDDDFELIKGNWTENIYYQDKLVDTRVFILY